ncbi:MAG TPA: CoA-binding protein, partial [Synergistaceae bacterium]|nr:CoA-binding protein [Synergistaceae bacterium]
MEKKNDLQRMFAPRSVAVIGASGNLESVSGRSLGYLKTFGYSGKVYPVNPKYEEIGGYACYPDVTSLPEAPDVALIMVRAALVPNILRECVAKGIPYAIIYSSGFAESEQEDSQEELLAIAREGGMRILGPNCQGLLNLVDRIPLTFTGALHQAEIPSPGHVAFISQSGAFGFSSYTLGRENGVGFRYIVTTGNQSDLDVVDCAHYVISDPEVRLLMIYLEGYNDGERFLELVRQARLRDIPVAVLKAGRSPSAQAAAQSHTAALTGDEAVWNAIFKQYCVLPMEDVDDITGYGQIFGARERTGGNRVAILTTSGGAGIVLADSLHDLGMEIPAFSETTRQAIARHIPDFGSPRNPVDMTVQISNDPGGFEKVLDTVLDSGEVDLVINAVSMIVGDSGKTMAEVIRSRYGRNDIPQAVTWLMDQEHGGEFFGMLRQRGIPFYQSLRRCAKAVKALASWSAHCACEKGLCEAPHHPEGSPELPAFPQEMTEYDAKRLLGLYDIPVTREILCQSMEETFDAAEENLHAAARDGI